MVQQPIMGDQQLVLGRESKGISLKNPPLTTHLQINKKNLSNQMK